MGKISVKVETDIPFLATQMSNPSDFCHVLVIEDQKSRRVIPLEESHYAVGRDPSSTILLYDRQASRHHATLVRVNDYANNRYFYRLIDGNLQGQKSTNGLIVNGRQTLSHELKHGDLIQFCRQTQASYHILAAASDPAALPLSQPLQFSRRQKLTPSSADQVNPFITSGSAAQGEAEYTAFRYVAAERPETAQNLQSTTYAEYSPYPIFDLDFSGQLLYLNPAASITFPDLSQLALDHPLLKGLIDQPYNWDGTSFAREIQVNQAYFEQHIHYFVENKIIRCYLLDVSRFHRLAHRYRRRKERFNLLDQQGTEGLFVVNASHRQVIETNRVFCHWLGYPAQALLALDLYQLLALADRETVDRELAQVTAENPRLLEKFFFRRQDGSLVSFSVKITQTVYLKQTVYCFAVRENSDRIQINDPSLDYRLYDPLTQLPNRTFFQQQLSLALDHAARHQHRMAVLFVNLDSFKSINSNQGHGVGDRILQELGVRIQALLKPRDTLARWGGDEFSLLLTQIKNTEEPAKLAQAILDSFLSPFVIEHHQISLKSSIGIALYPQDGETAETLLQHADTALCLAQQQGRNHYQFYHSRQSKQSSQLSQLETLLHQALAQKQFFLQYQPQVDLVSGRLVGLEALVGWRHPERGVIPASKFLPSAAKTDVIIAIGQWVLQTACEQTLSWQREGLPPLILGINLFAREFQQPNLAESLGLILEKIPLDPQWLELELTELTLRKHLNFAHQVWTDLQSLGVRIALDGYGTGFSSLGYLHQFNFNTIKINPRLIRDLKENSQESGVISAIMAIAHSLNLRVVAEGVENEAQVTCLRDLNCGIVQGNWVSQPLSAQEMTIFLRDRGGN